MRRTVSVLLALVLLAGACRTSDDASSTAPIIGTVEAGATGRSGGAGPDTPPSTEVGGPGSNLPGGGVAPGAADLTTADGALGAYLDALAAADLAAASDASVGGARELARARAVVATYNEELGGTSRARWRDRSFRVAGTEATRVAYTGSAWLDTTVSGGDDPSYDESAQLTDPVVTLVEGTWRVSSLSYDGRPMQHQGSSSNATVGGVNLRVQGALSFGVSTAVVIDLATDGDHEIRLDGTELRYADGARVPATLGVLVTSWPAFYFLFPREEGAPTKWAAKVTIDDGTDDAVSKDVVLDL